MEDAEATVRKLFGDVLRKRGCRDPQIEVKTLNSGGANYTSALFAATTAEPDTPSVFAKVAIVGEKLREVMNADIMFDTEGLVYTQLAKEYNRLQKERDINIFEFPEMFACDLTRGSETLLLEDLTKRGFGAPSRHRSAEWKFAAAALAKAADFHALSFAFEKHDPEKFKIIADQVKYEPNKLEDEAKGMELWGKIIGNSVQVVKEEYRERLVKHLSVDREVFMSLRKPINKPVLIHGDYRSSNLLYRERGDDVDIMVVDYQTVHTGSPAADLLYFIFLGTDQEFRRNHYRRLLDHYYERLVASSELLGVDVTEVYPREMFDKEIKEMLPLVLRFSSFILPIVTVDEALAPQTSGDDASQFHIAPNQLFSERFSGLVSDCVEWGVL